MFKRIYLLSVFIFLNSCSLLQSNMTTQQNVTILCEDAHALLTFFKMKEVLRYLQRDLGETPDICLLALKAHQSTYENVQAVANKCSTITLKELYIQVEAEDYMQIKSIKNLRAMMKEKWFLEMDQTSREKSDQLLQTFLDVRPLKENFLNFCTHTHSAIKQARQQSGR